MTRSSAPVIVLDGERSASLAVVRSLGRRGISILVGSARAKPLAAWSRYAAGAFSYPDPLAAPAEFRGVLLDALRSRGAALTIPVTEHTRATLMAGRDAFDRHGRVSMASNEALAVVLSRSRTRELAGSLGIPLAPGIEVRSITEGLETAKVIGFPIVVAPDCSVRLRAGGTEYAVDRTDLARRLTRILGMGPAHVAPPLGGEGIRLAVLCCRGAVLWAFQYRRLHEVMPIDGASACRVSEPVHPALREHAALLMRELSWDGVAELQFRRTGVDAWLVKIDGSFGDAVPLAIIAGADVPSFVYDLELHDRRDFPDRYRVGVRCRHLPSEVAWAREVLLPSTRAPAFFDRPRASCILADVARALSPWGRWDTQSITDVRPGIQELRELSAGFWQTVTWRLQRAQQRRRMRRVARHPGELVAQLAWARTILFVCLGNIIRSAFAAELLRARSLGRMDLRIRSAGLDAAPNRPADPSAVQCARRFGVDLSAHRTRRLDRSDVEGADVVLAMEIDQVVEIRRLFPQYRHKIYLFGCLTGQNPLDVADPVYWSNDVFEACFDRINDGVRRLIEMLPRASRASVLSSEVG